MKVSSLTKNIVIGLTLAASVNAMASSKIETFSWKGIPVTYLEDARLPTYNVSIYFADGALSDEDGLHGETSAMFNLLTSGTSRYSQKELADSLEFYGASYGANVTHEYSTYSVAGLVKDLKPTLEKICHLFTGATFPNAELTKEKVRAKSGLISLVNDHSSLASRAFREVQLSGSPFAYPVDGKLADIDKLNQSGLLKKRDYFNKEVAKHIYITGPREVLQSEAILTGECGWSSNAKFVRTLPKLNVPAVQDGPEITLIAVKDANQAQVRIGQYLDQSDVENPELLGLTSEYLGGGFTSVLMREVRVKRGLTYSIGSFAAGQKFYGRSGISTFTRNETAEKLFEVIKGVLERTAGGDISDEDFERVRSAFIGSHPFSLERSSAYLGQLMSLDHTGDSYSRIEKFPEIVGALKKPQVISTFKDIFEWKKMKIVVVGDPSIKSALAKFGKVKVYSYKDFL